MIFGAAFGGDLTTLPELALASAREREGLRLPIQVREFYAEGHLAAFDAPARQTSHPGSRATSYVLHGNKVAEAELTGAKTVDHWYQIAGVEVLAQAGARAIVTLGDSITDGNGSTTNGNDRWPDRLADRL